jgi:sialate O-acetylesterase
VVWFRKEFSIPEEWNNKELTVSLGPIDDMDVTYLNGEKIGSLEVDGFWQQERYYTVPANAVKPGKAVIAVRVTDPRGNGGILGDRELLRIYPSNNKNAAIPLDGKWQYKVVGQIIGDTMYLFDPQTDTYESRPELEIAINAHTPTVLYNAMIAPLTPFTLQGTIWYQGETNVNRSKQYMRHMSLLINDWRKQFNNENMPFYYVQLAPWHYNNLQGRSSAHLREAQRRSLDIPNTGMAVTLDIGNVDNIHPANKQEVGKRLAYWALANNYGENIPFSGPIPKADVETKDNKIIVSFDYATSGLVIKEDISNQFEVSGNDGTFYPATRVEITGDKIEISSNQVTNPQNVRYAYKNGTEASLFNEAGLPAPSCTTEEKIEE